jgi:hypothetical protein
MSEQYPPSEYESTDDRIIGRALAEAEANNAVIPHEIARMIGSQFHGGQGSPLYSFVSTGAIDLEPLLNEYCETYLHEDTTEADRRKLRHLGRYVLQHWRRGPVDGWNQLWGGDE